MLFVTPVMAVETPPVASAEQEFARSVERLALQVPLQKGAWEEVYARAANGIVTDPDNVQLHRALVGSLRHLGAVKAARTAVARALSRFPGDGGLLTERAWLFALAADWSHAQTDASMAVATGTNPGEALLILGIAQREQGMPTDALTTFSRLLQLTPNAPGALINRGSLLVGAGRITEGLQDLERAIALAPSLPESYLARGTAHLRNGALQLALDDFNRVLAISPGNLIAILSRATVLTQLGNAVGARRDLQLAATIRPGDSRVAAAACRLADGGGDWAQSAACAEKVLVSSPDNLPAWRQLAKARLGAGDLQGAIAAYDALMRLEPTEWRHRLEQATVHLLQNDYANATADCTTVIDQQPIPLAYALRALARLRTGDRRAEDDCANALLLDRAEPTALLVRANLALQRNDAVAAVADCERVMRRSPTLPWGMVTCGNAHYQTGDLPTATTYANRAIALLPKDPEALDLMARIGGQAAPAATTASNPAPATPRQTTGGINP
jgi:tetratricopeptide (TPR) repeat protein